VQNWAWFLDVVFGAIVVLGIGRYEQVVREVWVLGFGATALSLFVAACICCFVVYDIAVYHLLVRKFPYRQSFKGFLRFYLDLVMAFVLYLLLASALQVNPDWFAIVLAVSGWHLAAILWHMLARYEHGISGGRFKAYGLHALFVLTYWMVAGLGWVFGTGYLGLDRHQWPTLVLVLVSAAILVVSLGRWWQVLKEFSARTA
jgi:hypothetical protein